MKTIRLQITGMTCAACSARIEKALNRTEGIRTASVNLALAQAAVSYDPRFIEAKRIMQKIEQLGYGAKDERLDADSSSENEVQLYRNRFIAAAVLSLPLFWAMSSHIPFVPEVWTPALFQSALFQLLVATVLQFYIGFPFYYRAFQAMKQRSANMDVLVALSTSVAYFYSHYLVMRPDHSHSGEHQTYYFDTIAMIMTAVLLGKYLESVAKRKALKDLRMLYGLQVPLIRVLRRQAEEWIAASDLRAGDLVLVRGDEWISADGVVVSGQADVDESMLTGESRTVAKAAGDRVYSGTRSVNGSLRIKALTDVQGTRLANMIALVEQAQAGKPFIARKVNRVAAVFVPVMIVCAAITFAGWYGADPTAALQHAMAVLLVACPCALGLATPVSILISTGLAAKSGILCKEGRALEIVHRVDSVLLDKTGTLTEGKPAVTTVYSLQGEKSRLLRLAAAVEQYSAHPAAQAVADAARKSNLIVPDAAEVREIPGNGMAGVVEGKNVMIGRRGWLRQNGVIVNEADSGEDDGSTALYVAIDGRWAGKLTASDRIKPDAAAAVRDIGRYAEVEMITGDRRQAAERVAAETGISRWHAEMLPEHKLEYVRKLQRKGRIVAVVGDGINDTAALSAADIGIAMGGGTDSAMQAGDMVFVTNKLASMAEAMKLSRQTMRNIRQNLFFALLYNVGAIPFAAFGFLDPKIACVMMAASSVLVVSNALRLQRFKLKGGESDAYR
ncbi:Copper-exporting P-type ATPase [Paenibacillus sp. CECT 9249]|uniref:heavy metal translocating P-type ATPase n=1 Tax=Paenibacillus sp. CECT 9249 TaxID=2845385 RepID=UPI001E3EB874|nr:cation-translocating P-type ATPase [Paenibacillus sp. CECT 9249]CAH0119432.1 Copper-exporting P-type ATPase [Paenibacillus sp. CECT 9249]